MKGHLPSSRNWLYRAMVWCLLLSPMAAPAQTSPAHDLTSLNLEQLLQVKIFSASRHFEASQNAPAAVTVITADEIATYGWRTLADALSSLRSFYTHYDRNYAFVGVRGFRKSDDYNSRLLLLIDGHRLNENIYGTGFIGTDFPLDLDLIDRIEVVRGPSSSLYGTNAFFGVINIITRRPKASALESSGDVSSFAGRTGRLTAELKRERISGVFSGSVYRSAGHPNLFFPEFNTPETNNGIARNIDGDRFAHGFGDLQIGDLRIQGMYGSRLKIVPTAPFDTNFNDPSNRTTDTRAFLDVSYHRTFASQTDLDLRTYYDYYRYYGTNPYTDGGERSVTFDDDFTHWIGIEGTVGRPIGQRHRIIAGAKYEYNITIHEYNDGGPFVANQSPWLAATYGEFETKLLPVLTVRAGGRIDSYSSFGVSLNPRVAVIYSPNARTSLKYIFGRAFRAPNAYEMYYTDNVFQIPNPKLGPEKIKSHDVVLEHNFSARLRTTVEAFYNSTNDLITMVPDEATGMNQFVNHGRDIGRGLEFEIETKRASGLALRASYTLAEARDAVQNQRLANSPLHLAKLNASIPIAHQTRAGVELLYESAQDSDAEVRVPSSFLTNVTVSTKPLWGGWEFSGSLYNLFDRRWYGPGGPEHRESLILQDGRTYRFKITYRFRLPGAQAQ